MTDELFALPKDRTLEVSTVAIRPVAAALSYEVPSPGPALQPYANDARNGRTGGRLPRGAWRLAWQAPLPPLFAPAFVLAAAERIAVLGEGQLWLGDVEGKQLALGNATPGGACLTDDGALISAMAIGYIEARDRDGGLLHRCPVGAGEGHRRLFLRRRGGAYVVASAARGDPHSGAGATWTVEAIDIGRTEPEDMDDVRVLRTSRSLGTVGARAPLAVPPVAAGDRIAVARPGRIYLIDEALQRVRVLAGAMQPVALSADRSGRLYAVVHNGRSLALWVVTENGEQIVNAPLPGWPEDRVAPPVIDHTGAAFVSCGDHLVAINARGRVHWQHSQGPALASVTADDRLIVAQGEQVSVFEPDGMREVIFRLPGQELRTPPVLVGGRLLVASSTALSCLAR